MPRPFNTFKYGERKHRHNISLTDTAWNWLQSVGGMDWLEHKARDESHYPDDS